jgi:imidazolonepropionase-like amidohydrolase
LITRGKVQVVRSEALSRKSPSGPRRLVVRSYFDGERHHNNGPYAILLKRDRISAGDQILAIEPARPDEPVAVEFIMPTLVDAHVHVFLDGAELDAEKRKQHLEKGPAALWETARANAEASWCTGIGVLRDAGDPHGVNNGIRNRLRSARTGLRVRTPSAAFHRPGRYGSFLGKAVPNDRDLAAEVRQRAHGVDDIKVLLTGIIDFATATVKGKPQFDVPAARTIVNTARELGKPAFAHCNGAEGLAVAIAAKFDSIEHGYFMDEESLRRMAGEGIAWTPTFAPVAAQRNLPVEITGFSPPILKSLDDILAGHAESACRAAQLGVTLLCGSDAGSQGVPHGAGLIDEMMLMAAAGVPMEAILRGATAAPRTRWKEPPANLVPGARFEAVSFTQSPFGSSAALRGMRRMLPTEQRQLPCKTAPVQLTSVPEQTQNPHLRAGERG